jgi:hypothetical protein
MRVGVILLVTLLVLGLSAPTAGATSATPTVARQAVPPDEAANYVDWVYESLLFRAPDPGGRTYWTSVVQTYGPGPFVNAVITGDEWAEAWINAFYESIWLYRAADAGGIEFWKGYLQGNSFDLFETVLGGSPEVYDFSGGTDALFVEHAYLATTFAEPTDQQLNEGLATIAASSRADLVYSLLHSDAGVASRVIISYERTLNRDPDPGGAAYWAELYHHSGSLAQMMSNQIRSQEAWDIAQQPDVTAKDLRTITGLDR